jgi:hypothetical protein
MRRIKSIILTLIFLSIFFTSCTKEEETTTPETTTTTSNVHYLYFTLSSSLCSQVTVSVVGEGSQTLNSGGKISWELSPGNYTYTATCGNATWGPETINLIDNNNVTWDLQ